MHMIKLVCMSGTLAATLAAGTMTVLAQHKAVPLSQEHWTASDGPYKDIEKRISYEHDQGKAPQTITDEYKMAARLRPTDSVAQFAWIVAERGQAYQESGGNEIPEALVTQIALADPGNVHEYTRYRYCMSQEANLALPLDEVLTVGNRLLRYNSKDQWVRINMIYLLVNTKPGIQKAIPYAQDWVKQEPNNPKAHSTLALVYEDAWATDRTAHRADAAAAVSEYKKYLSLAPASDSFRHEAEYLVKTISRRAGLGG